VTIRDDTSPVAGVLYAVLGGRFIVRLDDPKAEPGRRSGRVLDDDGNVIGTASQYPYGASGYAVHTKAYGGFVPIAQVIEVGPKGALT
jgi:hypothetical protein